MWLLRHLLIFDRSLFQLWQGYNLCLKVTHIQYLMQPTFPQFKLRYSVFSSGALSKSFIGSLAARSFHFEYGYSTGAATSVVKFGLTWNEDSNESIAWLYSESLHFCHCTLSWFSSKYVPYPVSWKAEQGSPTSYGVSSDLPMVITVSIKIL